MRLYVFHRTTAVPTACLLTACKSSTHSSEEVPASEKSQHCSYEIPETIGPLQDTEKSFCALTAELVSVNRAKAREVLGRILSSLLSLHSTFTCAAPWYRHNTWSCSHHQSNQLKDTKDECSCFKLPYWAIAFQFLSI